MPNFAPEDWDAMLQGIFDWARGEIPTAVPVVWKQQNAPSPPKPFVALHLLVPPVPDGHAYPYNEGCGVMVKTVLNSTLYTVTINGTDFTFTSDADATAAEIVAGLIADINGGAEPVTASPVVGSDDTLDIEANAGAAAPTLAVDANLRLKVVQHYLSEGTATIQIDAYADPPIQAVASSLDLQTSLETEESQQELREDGWAVISIESVRRPNLVQGSEWENRAGFDVRLRCKMRQTKVIDYIEDAPIDTGITGTLT